jgi:hypothetical protein
LGTAGCGIVAGSGLEGDEAGGVAGPMAPSDLDVHAPTIVAAATKAAITTVRRG